MVVRSKEVHQVESEHEYESSHFMHTTHMTSCITFQKSAFAFEFASPSHDHLISIIHNGNVIFKFKLNPWIRLPKYQVSGYVKVRVNPKQFLLGIAKGVCSVNTWSIDNYVIFGGKALAPGLPGFDDSSIFNDHGLVTDKERTPPHKPDLTYILESPFEAPRPKYVPNYATNSENVIDDYYFCSSNDNIHRHLVR